MRVLTLGAGTVGDAVVARRQKRLSENSFARALDPWVRLAAGAVKRVGLTGHRRRVARHLTHAGNPWGYTAEEYIGFSALVDESNLPVVRQVGGHHQDALGRHEGLDLGDQFLETFL